MSQISNPSVMSNARMLANRAVNNYPEPATSGHLPVDAFMTRRPNSLAESYQHGESVANILASWHLSSELQAAGLLHSFVCKHALLPADIAQVCSPRTAFLCEKYWHFLQQVPEPQRRGTPQTVKRVKLYMAAYCDLDLAFLSAASLWDHFILARQSEPALQRVFAAEAQEVMLPVLDMLGLWALKTEAQEQIMQWGQNRQDYQYLARRLAQTEALRRQAYALVQARLQKVLPGAKLACKMQTPPQIYNPLLPEKAHPEAFQKLMVDILVDTEEECYTALRWVHRLWEPVVQSLVDHIGISKLNGDRYLHTTVIVPMDTTHIRVQFNIRSHEMEQINQWGLIALQMPECRHVKLSNVWWRKREKDYAKICAAPLGALPETLYVFSPQGQIFRFHRGCTVVDYAYRVHSDLADQCKRFKVNGEVTSPTTTLHHLDLVELERDPQFSGPTRAWLTAARTDRARSHISRFLKRRSRGQKHGRLVLNRHLRQLAEHFGIDVPDHRLEQMLAQMARQLNFERQEELLAEIAAGRVAADSILHPLFAEEVVRQVELPGNMRLLPHQLSLAQCCKPHPVDDIIGRPRYRDGRVIRLKIHRHNCERINRLEGAIPLKWRLQPKLNAVARLEMSALAEDHLLFDALNIFQPHFPDITLHKVDAEARNGMARLSFTIEAKDQRLIDKVALALENLEGYQINELRQMQLLFSEREELVKPVNPAMFNPYRRQPVQDRDMFFGRSEELAAVYNLLQSGVGTIFVQGQKRVGKTSLLYHLKKHYLDRRSVLPVFVDFQILGNLSGSAFYYEIAGIVYNDLHTDNHVGDIEPPLWELFETAPVTQLAAYLKNVQEYLGFTKLVLLIDEFSRTIDAYQQNRLDTAFFDQWRGIIHTAVPDITFIMVIQQQSYSHLQPPAEQSGMAPIWHLLELGQTVLLQPLREKDARQLIERPTFNHLNYPADVIRGVWQLTGGSPFLIHAFCFNLVRHMARSGRRSVNLADVEAVQTEFMNPHESLFAHLLDVIYDTPNAISVCGAIAGQFNQTNQPVSLAQVEAALPHLPVEHLYTCLQTLQHQHILIEPQPQAWLFASLLFGRWLAANKILEHYGVN